MKYLLTPLTMIAWYLLAYYGIYASVLLMMFVFSLSWFWLIIAGSFIIGLVFFIANTIPQIIQFLIMKIYGLNWFSVLSHSLAGLLGIISVSYLFYSKPVEIISLNGEPTSILKAMWNEAWVKTIFVIFPFFGLCISLFWASVMVPIIMKIEGRKVIDET